MNVYVLPVGGLQTNCYLVASDQNHAVVIDPGADAQAIGNALESHGLTPSFIILTHGHYDHIGAVNALRDRYGIPAYACEKEMYMLEDTTRNRARYHRVQQQDHQVTPDHFVKEGDALTLDELTFSILETPGHSKGGISILCGDLLFTGDTLFCGDIGYSHFAGGSDEDMANSLRKLRDLPGDYTVLPGHGPHSTLERERTSNPYILELG